jgi:tetratricopeptide (TPR) repeat protein
VLTGLFTLTSFLAGSYRTERRNRAKEVFLTGEKLAGEGHNSAAINEYRTALALEPTNRQYQIALATALIKLDRFNEAASHLTELLQGDPTNGLANLLMARIAVRQGKDSDAEAYYNRAIYGLWPSNPEVHRIEVRFELAEFLASIGANKLLLGELLQLQSEVPENVEMRKHIAHLFLLAGSPSHAADIYRELVKEHHGDVEVYSRLGEAEFERGNYGAARAAFTSALRVSPKNEQNRERLQLVNQVLALDPTLRGLSSRQRYTRSRELVEDAYKQLTDCLQKHKNPSSSIQSIMDTARKLLAEKRIPRRDIESPTENNIVLAEQLWEARKNLCGEAPSDEPLSLVLAKLSQ